MDARTARKLVRGFQDLERATATVRIGVITDIDPLSVTIGGSDVPYTSVKAIDGAALDVDDVVAALTFGRDLLILGRIGDGTTGAWIAATLENSWVNYGSGKAAASYTRDPLGIVRLRGAIKNGTTTAGTTILTLPAGYRPAHDKYGAAYTDDNSPRIWTWTVSPGGLVAINGLALSGSTFVTLDEISFRAEQ